MCTQDLTHWLCDTCDRKLYSRTDAYIHRCKHYPGPDCKGVEKVPKYRHGEMCKDCAIAAAKERQDERRGSSAAEERRTSSAYGGY